MSGSHLAGLSGRVVRQVYWFPAHIPEGCQSGRLGTPGKRVYPLGTVGSNPTPSAITAAAQSLSLLALLLFDLFWFVGLVHLALIADAKLFFCLGLRFLSLFQRFVELLLRRAERPFDGGQDIMVGLDRRWAGIYGCRGPVNLAPPRAVRREQHCPGEANSEAHRKPNQKAHECCLPALSRAPKPR